MEKLILKNIDFSKCPSYLMLGAFIWIVSVAMVPIMAIPQKPFQTVLHFIELYFTLYIYLGATFNFEVQRLSEQLPGVF